MARLFARTTFPAYNKLAAQVNQNYSKAAAVYQQRQMAFKRIVFQNGQQAFEKWEKAINDQVKEFMNVRQKAFQVANAVNKGAVRGGKESVKYQVYLDEILEGSKIKTNPTVYNIGRIAAASGIPFEKFLADNTLSQKQVEAIMSTRDKAVEKGFSNLLNGLQQTGAVTQVSALQTGQKDIRTDVALMTSKDTLGQVELTSVIDLHNLSAQAVIKQLETLADQGALDFTAFGFQVKTYQGDWTNRHWMGASVAADALESIFKNGSTWGSNYAVLYAEWYLSRMIINIVNPVNIGVITGSGLIWMSDFLQHYRFLMTVIALPNSPNVAYEDTPERGGGVEIFPGLQNKEIYAHLIGSRNFQRRDLYLKKNNELKGAFVEIKHLT